MSAEDKANAALIMEACSNYDRLTEVNGELLAALQSALTAAQLAGSGQELPKSWAEYCEEFGTAIAKA